MLPILALDVDGVILNFHDHWIQLAQERLGRVLPCQNRSYHFGKRLGLTREEYNQCWDYFREKDGWSTVPEYPGVGETLDLLARRFRLIAVTGIPAEVLDHRKNNLAHLDLPILEVHATGHRDQTKEVILSRLSAVAFVDDRLHHLHEAALAGVPSLFWVDRGDEQERENTIGATRILSLEEILDRI